MVNFQMKLNCRNLLILQGQLLHIHTWLLTNHQEKEILYFVSNRQGGAGGWIGRLIDPKFGFSEPVNISQINTADNEITPYYHKVSDFLYFSFDGREGLGGYDIYKAGRINNEFGGHKWWISAQQQLS